MKRKLGINVDCLPSHSELETLEMAHALGFESFFVNDRPMEVISALKKRADELGMDFEFIHAPFRGINDMWMPGMDYLTIMNGIKHSIDCAAACGIRSVITHVSTGWTPPHVNDLGFERYDHLVLYAKEKGVTLAFENLRMLGNLAVLTDRYEKMDNVMYCYDCGHEHCFTKTVCWMDIFKDRTICTHIHDNPGRPDDNKTDSFDWHLLPFDGSVDYVRMMRKLDEYNYEGSLMLEVGYKSRGMYLHMTEEDFLKEAYNRIKKISEM